MQTVFSETDTGFVGALARWVEPPAKPAGKAADGEAPPVVPSAYEAECVKMDQEGQTQALAARFRKSLAKKLSASPAADVLNAYAILLELLVQWELLSAQAEELAGELAGSSPGSVPAAEQQLRCSLLLSLYGLVQQHGMLQLRFGLLLRLIGFCEATGALNQVLGAVDGRVERVERWVREWELSVPQQKELWGLVFDAHAADSSVSYECALKYFALHDAKDLGSQPALHKRIVQGLIITIRSPQLFRCDELSQLSVVRELESDAKFAPLHKLLHIMARETYAEFLAFTGDAKAKAFLAEQNLPVDALARKMRLLTLVSLGHGSKELSYGEIAKGLQVPADAVEDWVMEAIGAGLITAKMDQVGEMVTVSMCAERDFGKKQWENLHANLVEWRDSIRDLLTTLDKARPVV